VVSAFDGDLRGGFAASRRHCLSNGRAAAEFAAFCTRNPKPCPIIEITPSGDPEAAR
jgi:uncharacterized protein YcsI (UPF0317 family)